jgi:hypothetical protein
MFKRLVVAAILVMCAGCHGAPTYGSTRDIEPEYRPLKTISERPDMILSSTAISTVGDTVYVVNLTNLLDSHPVGSVPYKALLLHEQEHAKRQASARMVGWLARYLTDAKFMWNEESRGWYLELITLRNGGVTVNVQRVAGVLSSYKTILGARMISRANAETWISQVLSGQWVPPPD